MDTKKLDQKEYSLPSNGKVVILNTGAIITPEAEAMLQALHSRSIGGIKSHLKILSEKGSEKFMSTYYVGYGHKSIGDCGTCTIFIEGVSMLVATAIQDWPLYSGQEASTRYIDFAEQVFIDPINTEKSKSILEKWRAFYLEGLEVLYVDLKKRFPLNLGEEEKTYDKAIKARAFDIMRGFLPAGASTNLAWHTNFRQAADHLMRLRYHPLEEVRTVAEIIETALNESFPSSFGHKRYDSMEEFNKGWMRGNYYYTENKPEDFILSRNDIDTVALTKYKQTLQARPAKTELPKEMGECGTLQYAFLLDFGSFRDIQRHRAIIQRMPLLVMSHGFGQWYINELPKNFQQKALEFIKSQEEAVLALETTPEIAQYYTAMGYNIPNRITGTLPALVYMSELRATRFVHPTLRHRAMQISQNLEKNFSQHGLVMHLDDDPDRFDIKRGEQDIVIKE